LRRISKLRASGREIVFCGDVNIAPGDRPEAGGQSKNSNFRRNVRS
jgi:exonuclease III